MISLLGEIVLFVGAAFAAGLAVGWGFWRAGRVSLPKDEWADGLRDTDGLSDRLAHAEAERTQLETELARHHGEVERLQRVLGETWDALADRDERLVREQNALRDAEEARTEAEERAERLQRRVAELAIENSRLSGVDPATVLGRHP